LDELPQLFNVLKGEMSIVGPRPPIPYEVAHYSSWHRKRLDVKPGITGLWQVSGRNRLPFERMVELDLYYIERWSLWLDIKILLKTIPAVLRGETE
jgi:lipopolysaccharide/colanic/teichoic acid biosynthesis glycosyltransferase